MMEHIIRDFVERIELKEVQAYENLAIVPLLCPGNGGPDYMTLRDALDRGVLTITEISEGGAVPELKVVNKGEQAVLFLDGEELAGAKQNRVLNTTILLGGHTETIIPVSCTEQGRWSYTSRMFMDADTVMYAKARREKVRSVSRNLETSMRFMSNQSAVWDDIDLMMRQADVSAPTGAMKDAFDAKERDLDSYLKSIPLIPDQKGLMVFINGTPIGFDVLSHAPAYAKFHKKLLKSYAMEALLKRKRGTWEVTGDMAKEFIRSAQSSKEQKYQSVGLGWDYRFETEGMVGSALVYENTVIHMAFFSIAESEKIGRMSGVRQRRSYRT